MGTDAEGERIKDHMRNITPVLLDQTVNNMDKLRIIALYVLSKNGIPDDNLNRLIHHAQMTPDDKQTIVNMANLGLNVVVEVSQKLWLHSVAYSLSFLSLHFLIHCIRFSGEPQKDLLDTEKRAHHRANLPNEPLDSRYKGYNGGCD